MAYQALYRQWRPKDFSHMVGQEAIVETLRNQVISGRIAHAYLFCGSRGTGKTSTAKILARAINCEHPENGDPCGTCANCLRLEHEESLDVIEIDAASNNGVDEMRDLRDTVKYPPQYGNYKVYIIDEVHMLSTSAFNALLKTLEEPPAHIVFILATTEPQKLPATILSRCQRFDFGRIPAGQIQKRLAEAVNGAEASATDGALMMIARAAEGGMRDALSILDMCLGYGNNVTEKLVRDVLGTSDKAFLFRFSSALAEENAGDILGMIDEVMRGGREPSVFVKDISTHIRTLLTAKCCPDQICQILELTDEDGAEYVREAERFTVTRLMEILDHFMTLETDMRYASSPRIALENAGLKCCLRTTAPDSHALEDRIHELESKLETLAAQLAEGIPVAPASRKQPAASAGVPEKKNVSTGPKILVPTGKSADEVWKAAMDQLKRTEPSVFGILVQGSYAGCTGGTLFRWQAPAGMDSLAQFLMNRKEKIEAALTETAGVESHFETADASKSEKSAADQSDAKYLQQLYDTFGTEPVDTVDEPRT